MHSAVLEGDEGGGRDTFVELGVLVVEGRVPCAGPRGYAEGPHCVRTPASQRHDCDTGFACVRASQLRQHMSLLWEHRVPVCVEVLLCPRCPCGRAKAQCPDIVRLPSPADLLLEQWTISCSPTRSSDSPGTSVGGGGGGGGGVGARGLVQAVRSQLHFSQLSAWWSSSGGGSPAHVTYRVTVPGEAFASPFRGAPPLEHSFPAAPVAGGGSIRVTVRTAPRMSSVPALVCSVHHETAAATTADATSTDPLPAPDQLLGACLLDPPQAIEHRRFQSPPRAGAVAGETPRRVRRGDTSHRARRAKSPAAATAASEEAARCRRRAGSPAQSETSRSLRVGGAAQEAATFSYRAASPALEASRSQHPGADPPEGAGSAASIATPRRAGLSRRRDAPWRPAAAPVGAAPGPVDDRMLDPCARAGKHDCRCDDEAPSEATPSGAAGAERGAGSSRPASPGAARVEAYRRSASSKERVAAQGREGREGREKQRKRVKKEAEPAGSEEKSKLNLELSPQEFEEVLSVLRERNPSHGTKSLSRSPDDGPRPRLAGPKVQCCSARVPAAPAAPFAAAAAAAKAAPFLDAILRTSRPPPPPPGADAATELAAKISLLSLEAAGTKRKRCPTRPAPPCALSAADIDERTLSTVPRSARPSRRAADLAGGVASGLRLLLPARPADKVPCDPRTSRVRCESVIDVGAGRALGADAGGADVDSATKEGEGGEGRTVPSASEKEKFRRSLDFAASMVFHSRTGLPLTSSPAPVRRNATCFDYDSSITSVSAIRCALFEPSAEETLSSDEAEAETEAGAGGGARSPGAGRPVGVAARCTHLAASLLGSFEESVLNGRLEPVSTVHGFKADIGASGSFCPRHVALPVTVFFYTLGDNDKVSTPYLAHINLGKKGYNVPRSGTIQVTLFNPLGTVVKMFVVMYDLTDMPASSQTFLRQRTLYMPADAAPAAAPADFQKWLRYLVHLRFSSSKSGRVYLHSDVRMIVFRKSDLDTATAHGVDMSYELRSFTQGPTNPKFSSRN